MKKMIVFGIVSALSLSIGVSAYAADSSGKQIGRMAGYHMMVQTTVAENYVRPAFDMMTTHCGVGSCVHICENWSQYCGNYADTDNNGVCDNYTDADNNGICGNWQSGNRWGNSQNGNGRGNGHHAGGHRNGCHNW